MSNPSPPAPSPDAPKSTGDPTHTASSRSGGSDRLRIVRNLLIATENNRAAVRTWFGPPSVRRRLRRKLLGLRTMPTGPRTTPPPLLRRGLLVAKANSRLRVPSTRQRTGSFVRIAQGSQFAQRVRDIGTPCPCRLGGRHHRIYHRCNAAGLVESVDEPAYARNKLAQFPVPSTTH